VSIKRHPANSRQVALPHLHANSTGLPGFVRILRISPRLPPSLPTTSVDRNAKVYPCTPTAQVCRFAQTEQSSDRFITWAARIILRHRSFLLSINSGYPGSGWPNSSKFKLPKVHNIEQAIALEMRYRYCIARVSVLLVLFLKNKRVHN
jgi:hypothetical protein